MSDDELVAALKKQLRAGMWTPQDRMDLQKNLKAWEAKYGNLIKQHEDILARCKTPKEKETGKKYVKETCAGIADMIDSVVLTRTAFEGEAGFTDMYDLCQKHIEQLLEWKSTLEGLIGIGAN